MKVFKQIFNLIKVAGKGWSKDNASMLAAGLAYYTTFAMAPLLVIAVAVASFIYNEAAIEGRIVGAIEGSVGREAAVIIQDLIIQTQNSGTGVIATTISVVVLLFGASGLFINLKKALNLIWGIAPPPNKGVRGMVKQRLLAFAMVLGLGLLLMISLLLSTIISFLNDRLAEWFPVGSGVIPELGILVSLLLLTLAFALIFKYLPDVRIAWQDVLLGALVTAALFTFGRFLISQYLSRGGVSSAYGAAGSLAVILLFVYYSMQIILFGAEFTQVYANRFGSNLLPDEDAQVIIRKSATAQELSTTATLHSPEPAVSTQPANHPAPGPLQRPVRQRESEVAAGLIGLAVGLLFAFFAGRRR